MLLFQVMFFSCFPASLYSRLHPPGWCILPLLERQHRDTWARLRDMMAGAAAGAVPRKIQIGKKCQKIHLSSYRKPRFVTFFSLFMAHF